MSAASDDIQLQYASLMNALAGAFERRDAAAFHRTLDEMARLREGSVLVKLGAVTHDIESALARFCAETRMSNLAEKEVPDARLRLEHVLKLTDEAAHHTMDLVEQAHAPAERTSRSVAQLTPMWQDFRAAGDRSVLQEHPGLMQSMDTFLEHARTDAEHVQHNLKEVMLAQGYQDLSGQIIRGVMKLIIELEGALVSLVRLSRCQSAHSPEVPGHPPASGNTQGHGPVVPQVSDVGVVNGQDDIDALLSHLNI